MRRTPAEIGRTAALAIITLAVTLACTAKPTEEAAQPPQAAAPAASDILAALAAGQPPAGGASTTLRTSAAATPVAESKESESSPGAPAASGALDRVQGDMIAPDYLLAQPDSEVPQVWIGWYVNRAIDAFRQAINENKPLVLVIGEGWCSHCANLVYDSLRCPAVDRLAGDAIFAFSFASSDKGASAIADSLEIDAYPTVTVLEPEARMLLERGRINGYFAGSELGTHLETILWHTDPRVYVDENGAPEPGSVLGTWNASKVRLDSLAIAVSGARQRGLKHATPAPKCQ